jgi:hypothetical protein
MGLNKQFSCNDRSWNQSARRYEFETLEKPCRLNNLDYHIPELENEFQKEHIG